MESNVRILHLADLKSESDRLLQEFNGRGIVIHQVKSKQDYLNALDAINPGAVICQDNLSGISVTEAFSILKTKKPWLPFILITTKQPTLRSMEIEVDELIANDHLSRLPAILEKLLDKPDTNLANNTVAHTLQGNERVFKTLLENSREAIILRDENYNILYRSPSAEKMTGWTLPDLKKISFIDLIHPEDRPGIVEVVSAIRTLPGQPMNVIYRNMHKNGGYVWIEMTITNMLDDKDIHAIVCNLRDITEHKNTENEILRSNHHFKALIENIADAIVLTDRNGTISYFSQSGETMTGFSQQEKIGTNIIDCLHNEDLGVARSIFRALLSEPKVKLHRSFRVRCKDGRYIWVEGSVTNLLRDESVKAIVFNFRDVTARRESDRRLEKSEANLRSIFDNTSVSYVLINLDYQIVSYNQQAKTRYKWEIAADIEEGASILDYLPEFRKEETLAAFNKVLGGTKHSYEREFVHEQEVSWYSVNMFPVYDDNKQILGLIIASEDITARKLDELEKEQMTADLIQHNKNLEQFAYIITHNLRSPVANIVGLSSIMSSNPGMAAADFEKCLEGLTTSVKKLDEVIIDLNFILQNRKEIDNQKEEVRFLNLVDDIKALTGELIEKNQVVLQTDFKVASMYTIKSYLHSIFINLIGNSIKYRRADVIPVISIKSLVTNNELKLLFSDNGLGIDLNSNGSKLFGLYKRFHKHVEGKGMGLYMVKTQVEMLGGKIGVESRPNEGTTFELTFPVTETV